MPNTDLFAKIHDQITAHPETHNQDSWWCGTTRCIAGWAVQLSKIDPDQHDRDFLEEYSRDHDVAPDYVLVAADLLGLTLHQAGRLFYEDENDYAVDRVGEYAAG